MGNAYVQNGSNLSLGTICKTDDECQTVNKIKATLPSAVCCLSSRLKEFGPTKDSVK